MVPLTYLGMNNLETFTHARYNTDLKRPTDTQSKRLMETDGALHPYIALISSFILRFPGELAMMDQQYHCLWSKVLKKIMKLQASTVYDVSYKGYRDK